MTIAISPACIHDIEDLSLLESLSYPDDEAASKETMTMRIRNAPEFFFSLKNDENQLIGFINGTCTTETSIQHSSMSNHSKDGRTLIIHSVVVFQNYRRQGIASFMLSSYIEEMKKIVNIEKILLLSKAYLLGLYMKNGFSLIGTSAVVHGKEVWFELSYSLASARNQHVQFQVDAFTEDPFRGNPAAVVVCDNTGATWMQNVATENNLSETVFLRARDTRRLKCCDYDIRWFTPTSEVDLCGHATLAAAHILFETNKVSKEDIINFYSTNSGILTAKITSLDDNSKDEDSTTKRRQSIQIIELDFPSLPPQQLSLTEQEFGYLKLGFQLPTSDILYVGRSSYDIMIEIRREAFTMLTVTDIRAVADLGGRGVIITCRGGKRAPPLLPPPPFDITTATSIGDGNNNSNSSSSSSIESSKDMLMDNNRYDFLSRCFFPRYGIDEDPVTGSAHCVLSPYWSHLLNENRLVGYQASKRGGLVYVTLQGDRVKIGGPSITTIKSTILV